MSLFAQVFGLVVLAALGGYWIEALRTKELARAAGRRACERAGVQFLDDTVELVRLRLRRDAGGRLGVYRDYRFEYARDGVWRERGTLAMLGRRVLAVSLADAPDAPFTTSS